MTPERQVGFDPLLQRAQSKLLEAGDLVGGEGLVCELLKRRAAPERERPPQALRRLRFIAGPQQATPGPEQTFEAVGVELVRMQDEPVALSAPHETIEPSAFRRRDT
jgi:hypothetical protein